MEVGACKQSPTLCSDNILVAEQKWGYRQMQTRIQEETKVKCSSVITVGSYVYNNVSVVTA